MKKAFTIVELLVAMALLAMLMAISSMVFSAAVGAYRTAGAATEIAAKLSTLTNRLERDFQSLPAAMPMAVWFEYDPVSGKRYDQIQFFSDGDAFESSKQWTYTKSLSPLTVVTETLSGNTARVYYGQANNVRIDSSTLARTPCNRNYNCSSYSNAREMATETILVRRAHLLGHLDLNPTRQGQFPVFINTATIPYTLDYSTFQNNFFPWIVRAGSAYGNDVFEYDDTSLPDWTNILANPVYATQYLKTSFANPDLANPTGGRPGVDLTAADGQSLHMILAQGVGSFSIQLAYTASDVANNSGVSPTFSGVRWWPSLDPDANPATPDSDFGPLGMNSLSFGSCIRFQLLQTVLPVNWWKWEKMSGEQGLYLGPSSSSWWFTSTYFPQAIKFTFTLYDSNGVFKDGKTFTYIVYLN